jgi:protein-disulfide isomerase
MNKGLLIGGAVVAVVALAGAGAMGFGPKQEPAYIAAQSQPAAQTVAASSESMQDLAPTGAYAGTVTESGGFTGDVLEGDPDAPVTIIEYASLTCPHCAAFHEQTYKKLKTDYIDTGKVKFIYRDFPLNNPAIAASIIARCAGKDKYLAFVDLFLSQQDRWTRAQDWMGELQDMAKLGGLGTEQINACLSDKALGQNVIDRYRASSEVFKINSTPTILIDGKMHTGDRSFAGLSKAIDAKL